MNLIANALYLFLTYLVTVNVGFRFYRNGRVYLLFLLHGDAALTDSINRILLTGYYLLNLGYAAVRLRSWPTVTGWLSVLETVASRTGGILLTLATIHFINMGVLYLYSRRLPFPHLKNHQS
ncbi:MAG: hypothetical protein JWP27_876 [Flaviaesturariibacter sp.]|nr:hypothetical protein [Flaviaesturariibacter sp.]